MEEPQLTDTSSGFIMAFRPAGPLRRLAATLADMVIFVGLSAVLMLPLARAIDWAQAVGNYDQLAAAVSDDTWVSHAAGILGLWTALWWAYFVVTWGALSASPGKWLMGLRIIDYRGASPIGLGRAALRLVAYMVSSVTLGIGHLFIVIRTDRRALHDVLAGTRVIRRPVPFPFPVSRRRKRPEPAAADEQNDVSE